MFYFKTSRKVVALTIDDAPCAGSTEAILQVLAEHNVRATFFIMGQQAVQHPELKILVARGDALLLGTVQPQGRAPMDASSWVNGARPDGKVLGAEPTEDRDPRLGAGHDG